MSNSTPQGPGPEFGSAPDASPLDERETIPAAMDEEVEELRAEGQDDGRIDISDDEGPDLNADTGNVDPGGSRS